MKRPHRGIPLRAPAEVPQTVSTLGMRVMSLQMILAPATETSQPWCDNKYCIWSLSPFLAQNFKNPWNFLSDMSFFFIRMTDPLWPLDSFEKAVTRKTNHVKFLAAHSPGREELC